MNKLCVKISEHLWVYWKDTLGQKKLRKYEEHKLGTFLLFVIFVQRI